MAKGVWCMTEQKDERIVKTTKALKKALLKLMSVKPIQEISITELVSEANVTRATFYKHYQYKEELLDEIMRDMIRDFNEACHQSFQDSEYAYVKQKRSMSMNMFNHIFENADMYKLITTSGYSFKFFKYLTVSIKGLLLSDMDFQDANNDIDRDLLFSSIAFSVIGIIIEWIKKDFKYSPLYMSEQTSKIFSQNLGDIIKRK